MKYKIIIMGAASLFLSGCESSCSEAELQAKATELAQKVQELAKSGDMNKLMEFSQKSMKISNAVSEGNDIQAACEAADELIAELN